MNGFVTDTLGQRQPFGERRQRIVVVAFTRQREPVQEAAEQQRKETPAFARKFLAFALETRRLGIVTGPVSEQPGGRQRQRSSDCIARGVADVDRLVQRRTALIEPAGHAANEPDREMRPALRGERARLLSRRQSPPVKSGWPHPGCGPRSIPTR